MAINKVIKGFVLNIIPYKNNDALVNVLTSEGFVFFNCRGGLKIDSKNGKVIELYNYSEFSLFLLKEDKFLMNSGFVINDFSTIKSNIEYLAFLSFLSELSIKCIEQNDSSKIYDLYYKIINNIGPENIILLGCIYVAKILTINGLQLDVDSCIYSHCNDDITGVSYVDGGLVSKQHFNKDKHIYYNKNEIEFIVQLFNETIDLNINYRKEINYFKLFNDLLNYLQDTLQIKLKSFLLLISTL